MGWKKGFLLQNTIQELLNKDNELSILYIEDNKFVQDSTMDMLEIYFDNITVADDGQDGWEKYIAYYQQHDKYHDIILTDINMPRMNGIELIEKIKEVNDRQDIIVLSAHNEPENLLQLIDLQIKNFILKPIDLDRFQKVFGHVIEIIHQKREFKRLHKRLAKAKQEAEEANELKSQFLANMSHEIRTPLNAIMGFITLLSEKEDDEQKLKYLHIIKNSSDSLLQIINDILDISKIESGKLSIESYNFNPYKDLIEIAELFQAKAAEKHIRFGIQYNHSMPEVLYSDLLRIKQIFSNLLSNAIKFTPEGSKVKAVIWYKDGNLNIIVKDYGIGISEEKQQTIFEPFTQADGSTVRKYGGTGLGLTISLELAHLLGGDLTLKSKEGKGSMFKLSIPVPIGEEEIEEEEDIDSLNLAGHILVVEDYEANRMFVSIILDNAGITYDMAHDGLEAIDKFKSGEYDLILMDENMPNMGGMEATKEILKLEEAQRLEHTPIVSLTANALQGDKERFLAAGFDDYLTKPIEPDLLLKTLAKHLQ